MPLYIHLFGQPRLLLDAQPVKWTAPPKTLPLLAYLLLHRAQAVERAQAAGALWPDDPEDVGRANLRRHLHQLQQALPPALPDRPWLLSDAKTIRWNPQSDCWLDVAEFETVSRQGTGRQVAEEALPLCTCPPKLEAAIELYRGDLLEGFYDDWVFFERERLRGLYLDVLTRLVRQHRAQRNYAQAIAFAQQLLARDPFREDAVRQFVALRYEEGDRAGAIHEYDAFARRLRDELGVAPMPETQALREMMLRNAPLPDVGDRPGPAVPSTHPAALLPFVGRDAEMEQAAAWWSRAARGRGSLALISGEAGVGKTRLAREVALLAESQGGRVLLGGCAPYQPRAYQPVVEALAAALPLVAALDLEPVRLAALAVLVPELGRRRRLPALPPLEPDRERVRLFDAVAGCLERLAEPRPLLVVLEDLHWAGEATAALVEFLARRAVQRPILLLGTYRDEEAPRAHPLRALRRQLQSEGLVEHLALGRLSPPAVASLLARLPASPLLVGEGSGVRSCAARLHAASEGLPLFVELLWQDWQEHGPAADALPGGLRAAIAQRLERLSPAARAYAEAAAVVGPAFDAETVREVGGWAEARAFAALEALLDRRLVRDAASRGHFDYAFTHHLVQAALYAEVPAARRQRRHLRVAHVLADLHPGQQDEWAGELAHHYDEGGDAVNAIPHYLAAARQRLAVWADAEAGAALDRALALADEDPDRAAPRLVFDLLLLRENLLHRRGERTLQRADLERLAQIAQTLGDERLRCEVWRRQVVYHSILGERPAEAERIQRLKACTDRLADPRWQAQACLVEGYYHALVSDYAPAQASLEQALVLCQAAGDEAGPVACAAACALADVAVQQGHFAEAQDALARATRLAETQSNQSLLVQTLRTASGAWFARQDFSAAEALGRQMLDLCRAIGDREGEADALARLAAVAARLFRVADARSYYAAAGQLYGAIGKRQGQAAVMVNTVMLLVGRLGRYREGLALTRQADSIFRHLGDVRGQAICALNEGMIALYLEDYAASRDASRRGLELARQMDSRVMEANALANLGAAERELGEMDDAIAHMEAGLTIRRALGQPAELGTDLCDLTVVYCRRGDLAAAQRAAAEMLALYAQSEAAMMHPQYILWAAAQTDHALGEETRAQELLDQAYAVMRQRAAAIPDPESHASFYGLPFNCQISAAHERGEWP